MAASYRQEPRTGWMNGSRVTRSDPQLHYVIGCVRPPRGPVNFRIPVSSFARLVLAGLMHCISGAAGRTLALSRSKAHLLVDNVQIERVAAPGAIVLDVLLALRRPAAKDEVVRHDAGAIAKLLFKHGTQTLV